MEKRNYSKPTMKVVKMKERTRLLSGSDQDQGGEGYIPSMGSNELNKLA